MPYVAPSNLSIPFSFIGEAYSPTAGDAISFVFNPNTTIAGAGTFSFSGTADIRHGVTIACAGETGLSGLAILDLQEAAELSLAAILGISGGASFYHGDPFSISGTGVFRLDGSAEISSVPMLVGAGKIAGLDGYADLFVGNFFSVAGAFKLYGEVLLNRGSRLSLSGALYKNCGAVILRHGCELHADGRQRLSGIGDIRHITAYWVDGIGQIELSGQAQFFVPLTEKSDSAWWVRIKQNKGVVRLC